MTGKVGALDAGDLLATIRSTVAIWAAHYRDASGYTIDAGYLAGLSNDIAFELGILEALAQPKASQ